jgi:hypothetical protein
MSTHKGSKSFRDLSPLGKRRLTTNKVFDHNRVCTFFLDSPFLTIIAFLAFLAKNL